MIIDDYDRDYYLNLGSNFTVKDKRKYSDIDMLMVNNNTFLPMNQSFGSFTQGGQYNLLGNYNLALPIILTRISVCPSPTNSLRLASSKISIILTSTALM